MSTNALVQARIDKEIKDEASKVLAEMGLTVSGAVRLMLTKVAREHALPFEILVPNKKTIEAMQEADHGPLSSSATVEELMADLNAPD